MFVQELQILFLKSLVAVMLSLILDVANYRFQENVFCFMSRRDSGRLAGGVTTGTESALIAASQLGRRTAASALLPAPLQGARRCWTDRPVVQTTG